jgi:PhoH-like ATPase
MASKNYIIDTNVLLHNPDALLHFEDNTVIIPMAVLKELDHFKQEQTERGRNARTTVRLLDELRNGGDISTGIKLKSGGIIRVEAKGNNNDADLQVIGLARQVLKRDRRPTIVVTKDVNLRIQASAAGVDAEDYETGKIEVNELYRGYRDLEVEDSFLANFSTSDGFPVPIDGLFPNEYLLLQSSSKSKMTSMGRVSPDGSKIRPLIQPPRDLRMVFPRNKEQHFLMDALLDTSINLVTVVGKAGSGKTLMAVAAGYHQTVTEHNYMKMLVARPTIPMGRDIGFLPGEIAQKLDPWMQPVYDALDLVAYHNQQKKKGEPQVDGKKLMELCGKIQVEPLTYIRGRSIHRQYVVIDETQSMTPLEIKTILTRAGPGTKIILTGDIYQIDNPYVDSMSNGLSHAVELFRNEKLAAHITLEKGVRSELATRASELM